MDELEQESVDTHSLGDKNNQEINDEGLRRVYETRVQSIRELVDEAQSKFDEATGEAEKKIWEARLNNRKEALDNAWDDLQKLDQEAGKAEEDV